MEKKNLSYKAENREIRNALEGLAYWIADENYLRERYGNEEPEIETCRKTIAYLFDKLDSLKVPFWVQNSVICFAENWRQYKSNYMTEWLLKNRNINLYA